jgi:hypothetical protein
MSYRIAGIDVHKKMLAVVVSNVEVAGARPLAPWRFRRGYRRFCQANLHRSSITKT